MNIFKKACYAYKYRHGYYYKVDGLKVPTHPIKSFDEMAFLINRNKTFTAKGKEAERRRERTVKAENELWPDLLNPSRDFPAKTAPIPWEDDSISGDLQVNKKPKKKK